MELFNNLFIYLPEHHIYICKTHYQGVLLSQLPSHLHSSHLELTATTRKAIELAAAAFPQWAASADKVVYPLARPQPAAYLPVFKNGFKCIVQTQERSYCGYILRALRGIQEHCREEHGWTNPRKRGRPYQGQQAGGKQMWAEGV